ncbi:cupin domain-containing protein [Candidatus Poribacteria bacterium]|nr:cupin domain-containing protein [Candidatus Poribacteria bacterium]
MNIQRPIILNEAELDWETWDDPELAAKSPVRWKILISGERGPSSQLSTGIAEMTPGTLLPLHHHVPAETYYVISGQGHVTVDDREASLDPGASVFIPSNAKHSLRCTGTENLVFLFTFAADRFDEIVYHFDV